MDNEVKQKLVVRKRKVVNVHITLPVSLHKKVVNYRNTRLIGKVSIAGAVNNLVAKGLAFIERGDSQKNETI